MKEFFGFLLACVVGWATLTGLGVLGRGARLWSDRNFAPQEEAVRRDVVIQSQAYSESQIRRLYELQRQYLADPEGSPQRQATVAMARHEFAVFDRTRLPVDLQAFAKKVGIYD